MFLQTQVGTGKGRTSFRLFSLLCLIAVLSLVVIPFFPSLVIRDTETNRPIWSGRIEENGTFSIRWTHSIHRTPVVETYLIRDGHILLSEMSFQDYGIGMESELAPGEKLISQDGQFRVVNMNRAFPALHLFIGQVRANHTLLFAGREIPLASVDRPGAAVTIQVEKRSILNEIGGY
ncbi:MULTISPECIES: DUF1850 domain-containing protein [Brevibacillus]|jgi:hypothetical protein|uniref:DUF1850 domain-containing protein n=1 Tax=Brevibacillus TaxID=55080 RepID=UPI00057C333E|nr:DUF1850 domain-containing protein [Brevibacillus borstelensis]MBE5395504.1 DUF1850 domain-containing protein [Brevibacillus borstelensis]MCC0564567.1 DUF1850 domain-containing protein [Brevibacillus borstelensis]MCM3622190.1 DUF1850 domain-containing protein [Brevibacillus borstelensis]MED1744593.1 DUF1850 domain-containing protein [Brevibacillus borstelensis]MED1853326.1 DUF1850 domain-containing protein [Brevibacillus borstelensis]